MIGGSRDGSRLGLMESACQPAFLRPAVSHILETTLCAAKPASHSQPQPASTCSCVRVFVCVQLCAGVALKKLAMCLFDFHPEDLAAACKLLHDKFPDLYRFKTDLQMVMMLPLLTWKRTVRRVYIQPELQMERLEQWWKDYIDNQGAFIDTSVSGQARPLVRGGEQGLANFRKVMDSQLQLVRKGMLSGR